MTERQMVERDLALTHDRIAANIAELRARLSPGKMAQDAVAAAGEAVAALPSRPLGRGAIAIGAAAFGLWSLLALRGSRRAVETDRP
jgi:hypothetical protein